MFENATPEEVIAFLDGSGEVDGFGFGERPAALPTFWWRKMLPIISAELTTLRAENELMREALEKDATRFELCADFIASSFGVSGTLRAERTIKAKHFALESRNALAQVAK